MKFIVNRIFNEYFGKLYFLILLQYVSSKKEPFVPYVFKGMEAELKQFPFISFVENDIKGVVQMCTATLVSETKLLCAAHCFMDEGNISPPENVTIYLGLVDRKIWEPDLPGAQMQTCDNIFVPPNFDFANMFHDVAVLQVKEPFLLTEYVQIAPVSTDLLLVHGNCTIFGWGYTEAENIDLKLRYATGIEVQHLSQGCKVFKQGDYLCVIDQVSTICDGDSGGPILCDEVVRGVASYGENFSYPEVVQCGATEVDIYMDLSADADFLHEHGIGLSVAAVNEISKFALYINFLFYALSYLLVCVLSNSVSPEEVNV